MYFLYNEVCEGRFTVVALKYCIKTGENGVGGSKIRFLEYQNKFMEEFYAFKHF